MKAYLPDDIWYDIALNMTRIEKTGHVLISDNNYGVPPVHLRGNSIIAISGAYVHKTTEDIRRDNVALLVLPGKTKTAHGDMFQDDGDSIDTIESKKYNFYEFNLETNCSLNIKVVESGYDTKQGLEFITIYGTNGDEVEATLDGKPIEGESNGIEGGLEFVVRINLKSKGVGQKWTLNWKSKKTNACNIV